MGTPSRWSRLLPALLLALLPGSVVAQAAVGERVPVQGGAYWNISVSQLQGMLEQKNFPLINVHIPFEGDLPRTDRSIAFDEISAHLGELPADKNAPVVLYCRSGRMSVESATVLAGLGYTNVYNLVGGFNAWRAAGLPMVSP